MYGHLCAKNNKSLLSGLFLCCALAPMLQAEVGIPLPNEWRDLGIVTSSGPSGSWDSRFYPGIQTPATATRDESGVSLYYIAADGDRESDGGPRRRALGLATSENGTEYVRFSGNPVATYLPTPTGCNAEEEGIWRASAALHGGTDTVIYYGGLRQSSCDSVQSDIGLAVSSDGRSFNDLGIVLSVTDASIWGSGNPGAEIMPAAAYEYDGTWHMFYISKEVTPSWSLGLASGIARDTFTTTRALLTADSTSLGSGTRIRGGSVWALDAHKYALFLQISNIDQNWSRIEARTFDPGDPTNLSEPIIIFDWIYINPHAMGSLVVLDRTTESWYMFYTIDNRGISLKKAPANTARSVSN